MEAQLAHGGFLLQPACINQTENALESGQPASSEPLLVSLSLSLPFSALNVSFSKRARPKRWALRLRTTDCISGVALFHLPPCSASFLWRETKGWWFFVYALTTWRGPSVSNCSFFPDCMSFFLSMWCSASFLSKWFVWQKWISTELHLCPGVMWKISAINIYLVFRLKRELGEVRNRVLFSLLKSP